MTFNHKQVLAEVLKYAISALSAWVLTNKLSLRRSSKEGIRDFQNGIRSDLTENFMKVKI